jgi:hypothetical protein
MKQLLTFVLIIGLMASCHKTEQGSLNIEVYAPKAFLPNDANGNPSSKATCLDGSSFRVTISNPDGVPLVCEFKISDLNGILLYTGTDISQGWNGKKNNSGILSPQGSYIYQLKATNPNNGDFKIKKGEFILLR